MHRVSLRAFQAKTDLEECERTISRLEEVLATLPAELRQTRQSTRQEMEYWRLRAESDRAMLQVETGGEW